MLYSFDSAFLDHGPSRPRGALLAPRPTLSPPARRHSPAMRLNVRLRERATRDALADALGRDGGEE